MFEGVREKDFARYKITIMNSSDELNEHTNLLKKNKFTKENDQWTLIIE